MGWEFENYFHMVEEFNDLKKIFCYHYGVAVDTWTYFLRTLICLECRWKVFTPRASSTYKYKRHNTIFLRKYWTLIYCDWGILILRPLTSLVAEKCAAIIKVSGPPVLSSFSLSSSIISVGSIVPFFSPPWLSADLLKNQLWGSWIWITRKYNYRKYLVKYCLRDFLFIFNF